VRGALWIQGGSAGFVGDPAVWEGKTGTGLAGLGGDLRALGVETEDKPLEAARRSWAVTEGARLSHMALGSAPKRRFVFYRNDKSSGFMPFSAVIFQK
jgi:hypothetical protein